MRSCSLRYLRIFLAETMNFSEKLLISSGWISASLRRARRASRSTAEILVGEDVAAAGEDMALMLDVFLEVDEAVADDVAVELVEAPALGYLLGVLLALEGGVLGLLARRLDGDLVELRDEHSRALDDALDYVLALLHGLGELDLLLGGEEILLADLAQVEAYRVVDRGFLVVVDEALLLGLLLDDHLVLDLDILLLEADIVGLEKGEDAVDLVGVEDVLGRKSESSSKLIDFLVLAYSRSLAIAGSSSRSFIALTLSSLPFHIQSLLLV